MHQRAGQRNALLHSAGKRVDGIALARTEIAEIEQLIDALLEVGDLMGTAEEANVVARGKILIERGGLRHVADLAPHGVRIAHGIETEHASRGPRTAAWNR